jgi:hypothetical protein
MNAIKGMKLSLDGVTLTWTAGLISFALLFLMIAASPLVLRYDEIYHLDFTGNVATQGWHAALVDPENQSAAGPLYPALHIIFDKVSGSEAPAVRWLNFVLMALTTLLIGLTKPSALSPTATSCAAFSIMAVPFLWTPAGLALTELPALAAFSGFILIVGRLICLDSEGPVSGSRASFFAAAFAGVLLGVAILGRQTYLVALPALVVLLLIVPRLRWHLLICAAAAIVVSMWLFVVWKGLVPPSKTVMDGGLKPMHGLMSLAYLSMATVFISPRFLIPESYRAAVIAIVAGILLALLLQDPKGLPAAPLLTRLLGASGGAFAGLGLLAVMFSVGLIWLMNVPFYIWKRRADAFQVFCAFILLALALTPIKITSLFSSRYLVGMLGVLILVLRPVPSVGLAARIVVGSLMGAATLYMKYHP